MSRQEDDERYENGKDTPPRRSQRTKFREFDEDENAAALQGKAFQQTFASPENGQRRRLARYRRVSLHPDGLELFLYRSAFHD